VTDWNQQIIDEFRANEGRVGGMFEGAPMILIHHVGAKTGTERVSPLVYFAEDDGRMVIVASKGGAPDNPAWYHNLKANPAAKVTTEGDTWDATARLSTPGERDEIWAKGVEIFPGLTKEQAWAGDRHIDAFVLKRP
jgi:deazaflavin-dependent oxidoreductase (nitroreductase family)